MDLDVPIKISNKLDDKKFGLAYYYNGRITIYLNKKHFLESSDYMINDVLPHEYAHAVMFAMDDFSDESGGHSKKWQNICIKLGGKTCKRYVNRMDIIIGKTNIFE